MSAILEAALCQRHQRNHCVLVSSGTVGLTLAMAALGLGGKRVALPAGVCLNVPLSVHYAEATPVYCDIDAQTLGLSPATVAAAGDTPDAVLAVHAYGNPCDIVALADYCRDAGIPLIEDVAVAQGASVDGCPTGAFGVASVLSFGRGKMIDVGGGGAILTDDAALANELRRAHAALPIRSEEGKQRLDAFSSWHTQLYNRHYGCDLALHVTPFIDTALNLREVALSRAKWDLTQVREQLPLLDGSIARRLERTGFFFQAMDSQASWINCHSPDEGATPWRANILVPGSRDFVLRVLLSERFKISSWYPPAQHFLSTAHESVTAVAQRIGDEVLNVWVNDEVDEGYFAALATRLQALLAISKEQVASNA